MKPYGLKRGYDKWLDPWENPNRHSRKAKTRLIAKQQIAEGLDEHIKRYDEDHEDIYNLREEEGLLDLTSNDIMESLSRDIY